MLRSAFFYVVFFDLCFSIARAQSLRPIKDWKYIPVDETFYQNIMTGIDDPVEKLEKSFVTYDKNKSSLIGAEALAIVGQTCLQLKWYFCSYSSSLKVMSNFPGSNPAFLASETLRKTLESVNFFDADVEITLSKGGFTEIPENSSSMANFYLLRHNMRLNFQSWAKINRQSISEDSFWNSKFRFLQGIEQVKNLSLLQAKDTLNQVANEVKSYPEFSSRVLHQIARLKFELKDYDGAEEIYANLVPSPREYGRALIERAWIRYLKKDYAIALGMLHTLKAPSLAHSQHPDQYKLQMLILRELCYFSEISRVAKEFNRKYEQSFEIIESGADLSESPDLVNLVFQTAQWLPWAELITQIRSEKTEIEKALAKNKRLASALTDDYQQKENQLRSQLKALLKEPLEDVARELLEIREQINLLEYLAGLDKIRPKDLKQKVKAEEIEKFAIEKIYWPQTTEFWRSEMNNIKVLISDRCQGE